MIDFEFDQVFTVGEDGSITFPEGEFAPVVYNSEENDVDVDGAEWEALTGYTGQYSYHGAVMHSSEYFGGGMRKDILSTPGTYVLTIVYDLDEEEGDPAIGWCICRKVGS